MPKLLLVLGVMGLFLRVVSEENKWSSSSE